MRPTITIDIDKKCAECGKAGATGSGICLPCATKAIVGKPMKTQTGKVLAARFEALKQTRGKNPT
jgi:uncharacterized OB-fold protein